MRGIVAFAQPVCLVACAVAVVVPTGGLWLPRLALRIFLCGYAVRWASVDRAWLRLREWLGVSEATGISVAMILYAIAGLPAIMAAVLHLPPAGAAIFSGLLLVWSAGWVWALRRISYGSQTNQASSS